MIELSNLKEYIDRTRPNSEILNKLISSLKYLFFLIRFFIYLLLLIPLDEIVNKTLIRANIISFGFPPCHRAITEKRTRIGNPSMQINFAKGLNFEDFLKAIKVNGVNKYFLTL